MTRIFLIALGFVLAGLFESFANALDNEEVVTWLLGGTYIAAVVVVIARVVFCWGGCGA